MTLVMASSISFVAATSVSRSMRQSTNACPPGSSTGATRSSDL